MSHIELHELILTSAKEFADYDHRLPDYLKESKFFQVPTNCETLSLVWDTIPIEGHIEWARIHKYEHRSVQEVTASFTPIVRDAVQRAMKECQHNGKNVFAALIVDLARNGEIESYFHVDST